MNKSKLTLQNKKIIESTHTLAYSASQALRDYLRTNNCGEFYYIDHPLPGHDVTFGDKSYIEKSVGNSITEKKVARRKYINLFLNVFYEMYLTLTWAMQTKKTFDLYIGIDNINAFEGIILKKLGKVKRVVYYTIDLFPTRFENKLLNFFYHWLDAFCVTHVDETWNVSPVMADFRDQRGTVDKKKYPNQYTVPIGIFFDKAPRKPFEKIDKSKLIFVGHLLPHMGVDLVIRAMPAIVNKIPHAHLEIIGGGEELSNLKMLSKKMHIEKKVKFYGWVRDRKKLENILSTGAIGLATFNTDILDEKVKNADPGKIKDYMQLGMPVIVTDAISTKDSIAKAKAGIVIHYNEKELVDAVTELLNNKNKLKAYRNNALKYVSQFDYNRLFDKNLSRVLSK